MASTFPTTLDTTTTFPQATPTTMLTGNSNANLDHPTQHDNLATAILALETKIGADTSADITSLDYLVKSLQKKTLAIVNITTQFAPTNGGFYTVPFNTIVTDAGSNFSTSTGYYTVPVTGYYMCVGKLRWADGISYAFGYGVGIHTSNNDGSWFSWNNTVSGVNPQRNLGTTVRVARFNAGDTLRMYYYTDSGSFYFNAAEMNIYLLFPG